MGLQASDQCVGLCASLDIASPTCLELNTGVLICVTGHIANYNIWLRNIVAS